MALSGQEKGIRKTYTVRYRTNVGPCIGWDTSRDPSGPETALVRVENARVVDGIVVSRGGQTKTSAAATGCVYGLIDIEGGVRMFLSPINLSGAGCLDIYVEGRSPSYIRISDNDQAGLPSANFAELSALDNTKPRYCFSTFGDRYVMGTDTDDVYEIMLPEGDPDDTRIKLRKLFTLGFGLRAASFHVIPGFPNTLYIGTTTGGVFQFDGTTLTDISPTGGGWPVNRVIVFSLRGVLHAAGSLQAIRRYVNGAWVTLSLPAGSPPAGVTNFIPCCALECDDVAYVGGYDGAKAAILMVDQTGTVTMGTVFTQATATNVSDFAIWNGGLYYLWYGIVSATHRLAVVQYGTSNFIELDVEGGFHRGNRLIEIGGRLFAGYTGDKPSIPGNDGAKLGEISTPDGGATLILTLLVDRFGIDSDGAFDIIGF